MRSIAESLNILLDTKTELKNLLTALGCNPSNNFTTYASEIEKIDVESIRKLIAPVTNNFTSYERLFYCTPFKELNCDGWKNENITSCKEMFRGMSNLVSLSLINFMTSNVIDMSYMFYDCSNLELILGDIDCSNLTNCTDMFYRCTNLVNLSLINIYANCSMSDSNLWSIDLSTTKVSDDCLVNIMSQLPDLLSKGISSNNNIKLILPTTNTLTLEQAQVALNKRWLLVNTNY